MTGNNIFLVSQGGRPLVAIEADDKECALTRAKGLGHILDFSPMLPLTADQVNDVQHAVPFFHAQYFEIMGFTK